MNNNAMNPLIKKIEETMKAYNAIEENNDEKKELGIELDEQIDELSKLVAECTKRIHNER